MSTIDLSHGAGGKRFSELLDQVILPSLKAQKFQKNDGALIPSVQGRLVVSTDAHVVSPLFFRGGNIGHLGFCGTVNDLAMMGANPLCLTLSLIIEEGFKVDILKNILSAMGELSQKYQIPVVAGDTKVVERGKADQLFISVSGLGVIESEQINLGPQFIKEDSAIILNGSLGDHSVAILSEREGLSFETEVLSDCTPLHRSALSLVKEFSSISCLRDVTRGGLAGVLNEICDDTRMKIEIDEEKIPVSASVRSACDLLGLDPLQMANEGKFILLCPHEIATKVCSYLRTFSEGKCAEIIGRIHRDERPYVWMNTTLGGKRLIAWPIGEQLPRIC